ncbi:hypothetical protein [Actinomadura sp. J1-007]|uniref:hypothetical protein n=1 Tax=Actinomadura sp. J1-007 TaxID=2661913 RepID=UPI00158234C1|nr:hypothetical protein [Actinomadura sp. J1-007]
MVTTEPGAPGRAPRRATYRDALAEPRFRVLFATRTVAIAADTLRVLALSVLVYGRTGSPLLASAAFAAGFLPQLAGGALLGALADRMRPRRLIAAAYALEAAAALVLALLDPPVAAALALVALIACATPLFAGASNRLVADVLTGDAYVLGRSLMTIASAAAQLLGLAFGESRSRRSAPATRCSPPGRRTCWRRCWPGSGCRTCPRPRARRRGRWWGRASPGACGSSPTRPSARCCWRSGCPRRSWRARRASSCRTRRCAATRRGRRRC